MGNKLEPSLKTHNSHTPSKWRFGVDPTQLIAGYKHLRTSFTFNYKDSKYIQLNVGYGWEGLMPSFTNNISSFTNGYTSFAFQLQYLKGLQKEKNKDAYYSIGPMYRSISGRYSRGFVNSKKLNQTIVFNSAQMNSTRIGLLPTAGIVLTRGWLNLDLRFELPIFYEKNKFSDFEDSLNLNSFTPSSVRHYQKEDGHIRLYPILALFIGFKG